jgi:hypothetical protein
MRTCMDLAKTYKGVNMYEKSINYAKKVIYNLNTIIL